MKVPRHLDWYRWRLLSSPFLTVTMHELETHWTIDDVADAHDALDVREELESKLRSRER